MAGFYRSTYVGTDGDAAAGATEGVSFLQTTARPFTGKKDLVPAQARAALYQTHRALADNVHQAGTERMWRVQGILQAPALAACPRTALRA